MALTTSVLGVAVFQAAPASAACSPVSNKFIGGTLTGQDHRDINGQIGLELKDVHGYTIGMNGCRMSGYSKVVWMNMNTSGDGAVHSTRTTNVWRVNGLPNNAVNAWIEVYTRTNTGKGCPTCDGVLDTHRYGWINRRAVHLLTSYNLIAPLNCGLGGNSGNIQGYLKHNGARVAFDRIYAWSELTPDGSKPLQGWGQGMQANGYYKINNLASGQTYVVQATYHGVTQIRQHIMVNPCKAVPLSFNG
jgi:hypothetical protein